MILRLHRFLSGSDGTFGVLVYKSKPLCVTCENPWFRNQRNVSCIPAGLYDCVPHNGIKYRDTWKLLDVPDRSGIVIHRGNTINDTEGCILVGRSFKEINGLPGITDSRKTMDMLRRVLPETFDILITDYN